MDRSQYLVQALQAMGEQQPAAPAYMDPAQMKQVMDARAAQQAGQPPAQGAPLAALGAAAAPLQPGQAPPPMPGQAGPMGMQGALLSALKGLRH